ncbi:hypothetical protein [Mameliella alba]|uniref:hypothetical protein n=1 Tax=Mameliella alba TaxID=561184 RepID=UPI000B536AE8|nr:hypothetical protein [Mameliella alba]MBY6118391.1 hypothetical protein [Mameliella alba]OWV43336.1 hypothetical protein CDZ95_11150 [Mameliella alba]OWV68473.1 hypothetical protein CDZ97_01505 [Mameliella alba]
MPRIIRLYITQSLVGAGLATVFVAGLLVLDVGNLWHLATRTAIGPFAVLLLWVHCAAVFAAVQFAISVMRLGERETPAPPPPSGPRRPLPVEVTGQRSGIGCKPPFGRPG